MGVARIQARWAPSYPFQPVVQGLKAFSQSESRDKRLGLPGVEARQPSSACKAIGDGTLPSVGAVGRFSFMR